MTQSLTKGTTVTLRRIDHLMYLCYNHQWLLINDLLNQKRYIFITNGDISIKTAGKPETFIPKGTALILTSVKRGNRHGKKIIFKIKGQRGQLSFNSVMINTPKGLVFQNEKTKAIALVKNFFG